MSQYDNNLSGVLFKNDKQGNEKRPDYKGACEINGTHFWLSAWIKDKKDGTGKFMSLKFEEKEVEKPKQSTQRPQQRVQRDESNESIPF